MSGYGDAALAYYATQSPLSDPGDSAALALLPRDPAALVRLIAGIILHPVAARKAGLTLPPDRLGEQDLRYLPAMLARLHELDDRPLAEARSPERRLVGCCRDQVLLLCAALRAQGRPARCRAGFATYLIPGFFTDHWLCEYWSPERGRWCGTDAGISPDDLAANGDARGFDPLDVPPDRFLIAGEAWRRCRAGEANPNHFGLPGDTGLGYIGSQLVRDLAALNKRELLCWDTWGVGHTAFAGLSDEDCALGST